MNEGAGFKGRHVVAAGAAACAVCCAAPVVTILGLAGVAATAATFMLAGVVFGLVVGAATLVAAIRVRRRRPVACEGPKASQGPVTVELRTPRQNGQ